MNSEEQDELAEQERAQRERKAAQEQQYFEYMPDPEEHKIHADSDKPLTLAQEKELLKKKLLAPQPRKRRVKKEKRDQVYRADCKSYSV